MKTEGKIASADSKAAPGQKRNRTVSLEFILFLVCVMLLILLAPSAFLPF